MINLVRTAKIKSASDNVDNRVLVENSYLVEFARSTYNRNHFDTIAESLRASHNIHWSAIRNRSLIHSSLFTGASFTITVEHPIEAIEMIKDAIVIYPIHRVSGPDTLKMSVPSVNSNSDGGTSLISHDITGVAEVQKKMQNFGKGVRVRKLQMCIIFISL